MTYWFNWLAGILGGTLGWYFGGCDGLLYVLLGLTTVDYISGVIAAYSSRELSSAKSFKGIVDQADTLRTAVIFYIANENLSIIENAIKFSIPIPDLMKDKLAQIKDSAASSNDTNQNKDTEKFVD